VHFFIGLEAYLILKSSILDTLRLQF
jgi:hypothetical protein